MTIVYLCNAIADDDEDDEFDYEFYTTELHVHFKCCVALSNHSNHGAITSSPCDQNYDIKHFDLFVSLHFETLI